MWSPSSSAPSPSTRHSNLRSFLRSVTPNVPSKPLSQSQMHELNSLWYPFGKEKIEYFRLGDLWACYDEWSAYGTGVPLVLKNGDEIVQYYVPYLSGIQIYTTKSPAIFRIPRDDPDAWEFEAELWSDESESDKLSRSCSNNSRKGWDATSADSSMDHEGSWSTRNRLGYLYFQYYDTCSPYWRIPLVDKIVEFAQSYPGLVTLKSIDLSPASWMAIAWYPIYHIPTKGTVKDLSACFLTYHTLSSSFQDTAMEEGDEDTAADMLCSGSREKGTKEKFKRKTSSTIPLPPYGLATYRMQGDLWINPMSDYERLINLQSAADSWLKQLSVQHHDFNFFTSHSNPDLGMP